MQSLLANIEKIDWELVFDKFLGGIITCLMMLIPTIILWLKSKAAENEAKAARIQSEINAMKADQAANEAKDAKAVATNLVTKMDDNTRITEEINQKVSGIKNGS